MPSGKVSALDLPPSDSINFDHTPAVSLHASSITAVSLPISTLPSETVATPAATSHASDSFPSGEHTILHIAIRQPVTPTNNSSNQSGTATQTTADTGHHFTLNDFDPEAVQVFFQQHETTTHGTSSSTIVVIPTLPSSNATNGSSAITSPPSHGGTENPTTTFPTETNVALNTWSAPELVNVLNEFAFSGTHPLAGSMQPSDYLRMAVSAYEKANGGPIQLIVFDEATPLNSIFPLTKGVLFVEDKEL
ncbi:MAG: hypothetical protein F8N15_05520, partial [Methanobacterium sp.]|nr:hypothetical protein [Methanobacterium sp.]